MVNYTAKYTKIDSGYLGQLVEWPEVVTEGKDLEDLEHCPAVLQVLVARGSHGRQGPGGLPGNAP